MLRKMLWTYLCHHSVFWSSWLHLLLSILAMQEGFEAAFLSEGAAQRSDAASAEIPSSHQGTCFFNCYVTTDGGGAYYVVISKLLWHPPPSPMHRVVIVASTFVWTMTYAFRPHMNCLWCLASFTCLVILPFFFLSLFHMWKREG